MILIDHDEQDDEPRKRVARSPSPPAPDITPIGAEMYSSAVNVLDVPAFPRRLRDHMPYPDGRAGSRPADAPFGRHWTEDQRTRQLVLQHDELYQFAAMTAAKINADVSNYFVGGANGDRARMEMLASNALSQSTLETGGGAEGLALLPKSRQDELREQFERAYDVGSEEFVRALQQETLEHRTPDRPVSDAVAAMPWLDRQRQSERARPSTRPPSESELSRALGRPALPTPAAPGPKIPAQQMRPGPAPALMQVLVDERERAPLGVRAREETERQRVLADTLAEKRERAPEALSTVTPDGHVIHNITDKWSVLMYLLKKGPTEPELKAWRLMFDEPEVAARGRGESTAMLAARGALSLDQQLATPEGRQKYLRDLLSVQKLLNSGQGGMDWTQAPQHTGVVFFTPAFGAAVASATQYVHGVCGKPWALEIDMMTHQRVRDSFSWLVAHYLQEGMAFVSSRFASTQRSDSERRRKHARLGDLFRTLVMAPDKYLGFREQLDLTGDARRRTAKRERVHYLETHGQYYSDVRLG